MNAHEHKMNIVREEVWRKAPVAGARDRTFKYPCCGGREGCGAIFMNGEWYTNPAALALYGVKPEDLPAPEPITEES